MNWHYLMVILYMHPRNFILQGIIIILSNFLWDQTSLPIAEGLVHLQQTFCEFVCSGDPEMVDFWIIFDKLHTFSFLEWLDAQIPNVCPDFFYRPIIYDINCIQMIGKPWIEVIELMMETIHPFPVQQSMHCRNLPLEELNYLSILQFILQIRKGI